MADSLAGSPPPPGFEDALSGHAPASVQSDSLTGAPPPQGFEQALYGGVGQQAIAGLEGLARGASLGTSDLAETRLLGIPAEDIKAREEQNPGTAIGTNMLGGAGLIGLTGGLAAPAEAGLLGAGASGLAAKALAYGAEGAVFGAGNTVSDYALGDPNLNAQKVLSNVGMGALLGAGIGAATHGVQGIIGKSVGSVADKANASAETAEALSGSGSGGNGGLGGGAGATGGDVGLLAGLNTQKGNAQEIIKAGEAIGAPVTEAMTSDNRWLQRADDALVNGAPTYSGIKRAKLYEQGYKAVNDALDGVLDTGEKFGGGPMTKSQLGEALQGSLTSKISAESEPIEQMYEALKPHMEAIEVPESKVSDIAKGILEMPETRTSFSEGSLAKNVAKDVLNLETVEDVRNYKSALNRSIAPTASAGEKHMAGVLADKLTELEEGSILKAASNTELPPEVRSQLSELIDAKKSADLAYKPFREGLNSLTEQLGKKNAGGAQTAVNFIQDLDPEKLAEKLFDKKYASFNKFFAEKFPEESALMRQYQKQALKDAASKSGTFSPKVFLNKVNELQPEIRSAIFHPDELEKINAAKTYLEAIPKNFNPSGTSGATAFRSFFEKPTGAALANLRDFGIEAFMKAMGTLPEAARPNPYEFGAEMADKFNKMSAVQKIAQEADQKIAEGAKSIFRSKDAVRGAAISAATLGVEHSYNKVVKDVKNLADNPAGIVDHLTHHVGNLHQSLPNVTQGIHNTALAGLSFLNSKLPRPANDLPMSAPYKPSDAEKAKFVRYFNAVNNPIGVLDQVKHGTLSSEALEALQHVHPQLFQQMQKQVAGELKGKDHDQLPYSVKMSVAKFLGTPLDSSMLPQVIRANQASLAAPQMGTQSAAPTGRRAQGSMNKLNLSQRVKTQTQDDESDTN